MTEFSFTQNSGTHNFEQKAFRIIMDYKTLRIKKELAKIKLQALLPLDAFELDILLGLPFDR